MEVKDVEEVIEGKLHVSLITGVIVDRGLEGQTDLLIMRKLGLKRMLQGIILNINK